jgi:SanA protein
VRAIIVSGDNQRAGYDEPTDMKTALIALGVPERSITCDYAGFSTLDSILRAKEIFGQNSVLIVSQRFHVERAIYLARSHGIDATGYAARDVSTRNSPRTHLREWLLSRPAAVLDALLGTKPKFGGPKVPIAN